jgi:hypothetical protein
MDSRSTGQSLGVAALVQDGMADTPFSAARSSWVETHPPLQVPKGAMLPQTPMRGCAQRSSAIRVPGDYLPAFPLRVPRCAQTIKQTRGSTGAKLLQEQSCWATKLPFPQLAAISFAYCKGMHRGMNRSRLLLGRRGGPSQ